MRWIVFIFNLILSIIFLFGCTANVILNAGIYSSYDKGRISYSYHKFVNDRRYSIGDTLTLNKDKTFQYKTCGGIQYGSYHQVENKLILSIDSSYSLGLDSLYHHKYIEELEIKDRRTLIYDFEAKSDLKDSNTFQMRTELRKL